MRVWLRVGADVGVGAGVGVRVDVCAHRHVGMYGSGHTGVGVRVRL